MFKSVEHKLLYLLHQVKEKSYTIGFITFALNANCLMKA